MATWTANIVWAVREVISSAKLNLMTQNDLYLKEQVETVDLARRQRSIHDQVYTIASINGSGKTAIAWPAFTSPPTVTATLQWAGSVGNNPTQLQVADISTTGCNFVFLSFNGAVLTSGAATVHVHAVGPKSA